MSTVHLVPENIQQRYHVKEWRNAAGTLATACPQEWADILDVLRGFRLLRSEIVVGGGNRSLISRRIDGAFHAKGWQEKDFATAFIVDADTIQSPTHAVDCFRGDVALEVEWNNKDPFFDRDLNNFRLLVDLRAIQVGVIITRATGLQAIFKGQGNGVVGQLDPTEIHFQPPPPCAAGPAVLTAWQRNDEVAVATPTHEDARCPANARREPCGPSSPRSRTVSSLVSQSYRTRTKLNSWLRRLSKVWA